MTYSRYAIIKLILKLSAWHACIKELPQKAYYLEEQNIAEYTVCTAVSPLRNYLMFT